MTEASPPFPLAYGNLPWLVPKDDPDLIAFFRSEGTPLEAKKGELRLFGEEQSVYLIEEGIVATLPGAASEFQRVVGLFGPETVLGAVRAVSRGSGRMPLRSRALCGLAMRRVGIPTFLDFLESRPDLHVRVLKNCIGKTECQLEGALMNDLFPTGVRLAMLLEVFVRALGRDAPDADGFVPVPLELTVSDLATFIHATREMTSRSVSEAVRGGLLKKVGRKLFLNRTQTAALLADLPR